MYLHNFHHSWNRRKEGYIYIARVLEGIWRVAWCERGLIWIRMENDLRWKRGCHWNAWKILVLAVEKPVEKAQENDYVILKPLSCNPMGEGGGAQGWKKASVMALGNVSPADIRYWYSCAHNEESENSIDWKLLMSIWLLLARWTSRICPESLWLVSHFYFFFFLLRHHINCECIFSIFSRSRIHEHAVPALFTNTFTGLWTKRRELK